jgi:glycosyltransferase involved in cell wall biosynthesis
LRTLQIGDFWFSEEQGGLSRYYYELLNHLPATGVESRGLVVGTPAVEAASAGRVSPFSAPEDGILTRMRAVRRAAQQQIASYRPDLLVSHFAIYAAPLADLLARNPNVVHFHGPWAGESGVEGARSVAFHLKATLERLVYGRGTRLIVLSDAFRQELMHGYGVPFERIRIVPGGVDTELFNVRMSRATAREYLGWPQDRPILLTVRRQVRRMGLENLIDATAEITKRVPDVLVLLAGSGLIASELRQRIQDRGLENHVRLLGRVPDADLPTIYRAADLTVVPTVALEGFGLITLESLASGTPVYVTPVGGLPEVVRPFDSGCVFEDSSVEAIASHLTAVLTGASRMPTESGCRSYAADHFAWPHIAERIRDVYVEALSAKR